MAGFRDAEHYVERAVTENVWSDAVLLRARGRLTRDQGLLTDAAGRFERIGAAFEHARTVRLLSDR